MVYVVGVIGFICGFITGLSFLNFLLRDVPRKDLLEDPYIKWKYGLLCWGMAGAGAYVFIGIYNRVFI